MNISRLSEQDWAKVNEALCEDKSKITTFVTKWCAENPKQKRSFTGVMLGKFHIIGVSSSEGSIPTQLQKALRERFNKKDGLVFRHTTDNSGIKVFTFEPKNLEKFVTKVLNTK